MNSDKALDATRHHSPTAPPSSRSVGEAAASHSAHGGPTGGRWSWGAAVVSPSIWERATSARSTAGPPRRAPQATVTCSAKVLLAALVVVAVARVTGALALRIGQPRVVGEIVGGFLLGPTVLGALAPGLSAWLVPADALPALDAFAQLGLVLFMFLVGLELDTSLVRRQGHQAAVLSNVGMVVPFTFGVGIALALHPTFGDGVAFAPFALFLGASMAITAFPVLARILDERGLARRPAGRPGAHVRCG